MDKMIMQLIKIAKYVGIICKTTVSVVIGYVFFILALVTPLIIWGGYEYFAYRYVIDDQYNVITDKCIPIHLLTNGQSMEIKDDVIYAYAPGRLLIVDQSNDNIKVYIEDSIERELFNKYKHDYYGGKMKIYDLNKSSMEPFDFNEYQKLKSIKTKFENQGLAL